MLAPHALEVSLLQPVAGINVSTPRARLAGMGRWHSDELSSIPAGFVLRLLPDGSPAEVDLVVPILNQGFRWQLQVRPFANLVLPEFMRAAFGISSTAVGPMANAGRCPKFLRWGHA